MMIPDFTVSVRSHDEDGSSVVAEVSLIGDRVAITSLTVTTGAAGIVVPDLTCVDLPALLRSVARALTPGGWVGLVESNVTSSADDPGSSPKPKANRRTTLRSGAGRSGVPSDLATIYWRLGTITKVANHYKIDKHTARAWIKQLSNRTNSFRDGRVK